MNKHLVTLIFYTTFSFLIFDPIYWIGLDPRFLIGTQWRVYVFGIPFADLALALMLLTFFVNITLITTYVSNKILIIVGISIFFFLIQGIIINGTSNFSIFNNDIRCFLWFYGGIAFAYELVSTEKIIRNLKIIVSIITVLIIIAFFKCPEYSEFKGSLGVDRITHPSIFTFCGWLFVPLILLFNITPPKISKKIIPLFGTISFIVFVAILSATRSITIISIVFLILFVISLKFRIRDSYLFLEKSNYKVTLPLFLFIAAIVFYYFYSTAANESRILEIFNLQILLKDSRVMELTSFFEQSNLQQLILGRGFGGRFNSVIYNGELTDTLHIGILNFLMKMGFIPFLFVCYLLLISIPIKYLSSFKAITYKKSSYYHTVNVSILPALFPWILSLLLSGGYSDVSFLFVGFVLFIYGIVKTHGINSIIK